MKKMLLLGVFLFLAGCTPSFPENVVLNPEPREITSSDDLSEELASQPLYWQDRFIYLDGTPMINAPSEQFLDELRASFFKISHDHRYIAYEYGFFRNKIGIWDTRTQTHQELVNTSEDVPYDATLSGIDFTENDNKIILAFTWNENSRTHTRLATVDIATDEIEELEINNLGTTFFNIESSMDGKWVVSDKVTQGERVCLLIDLEEQDVKCLIYEEGWYSSVKFTPDSKHIVYGHRKKFNTPSSIMRSKVDRTENKSLVSGFMGASPIIITRNEIVFVANLYDDTKCTYLYMINQDGSNFSKLSYLGEQCLPSEDTNK